MAKQRKTYSINLDPIVVNALDAYIIAEGKRIFKEGGNLAHTLRYWGRNVFIECAIKKLTQETLVGIGVPMRIQRKSYSISLDPIIVKSLDAYVLSKGYRAGRNIFIEHAIQQLIKED